MIRLTVRTADEIERVLLKVKESSEYKNFLEQSNSISMKLGSMNDRDQKLLYRLKFKVLKKIHEQTDAVLYSLVERYRSKKKKDFYTKRAIRAYGRFVFVLKNKAYRILPEIHLDLREELECSTAFFDRDRVLQ